MAGLPIRKVNNLTSKHMGAIRQELNTSIRHERMADRRRCAVPTSVTSVIGNVDRGREGRSIAVAVEAPDQLGRSLDADSMSPREAMAALYRLKEML